MSGRLSFRLYYNSCMFVSHLYETCSFDSPFLPTKFDKGLLNVIKKHLHNELKLIIVEQFLRCNGGDYDSFVAGRRGRAPSVAEAEMNARQQRLNSQLTRANENLQRATVAALEADRASMQVCPPPRGSSQAHTIARLLYSPKYRLLFHLMH
jgi:hypothetical protein